MPKEVATTNGYKIYPFSDEPGPAEGYVEVYFDSELFGPKDRQIININMTGSLMSLEKTRQLIDALERGMQLISDDHRVKLKRELEEMQKKVRAKN